MSSDFSFSLGEEAFFIVGLHPGSSRPARRFRHPTLIFNPHAQFDELRSLNRYEKMKNIVRKRDILFSGSINPMLSDYGNASEALQYSGRHYGSEWTCPLKTMHATTKDNSTPE
jgi:FPC/CPF motif-containing protein YcgG